MAVRSGRHQKSDAARHEAVPHTQSTAADVNRGRALDEAVAEYAERTPLRGIRNIAGPEIFPLDELGRTALSRKGDDRAVITDPTMGVFALVPRVTSSPLTR